MSEKEKKKQVIKISVFITSIFVILLSVTYAFINVRLVGEKRQVITAGELSLELEEDENNLTITNALPMYDEVGMMQDAFTFRLVNKGTNSANYILKLVDITTGEKLDTSIVKYGLTKDGTSNIKYLSNLINGQIDNGKINGKQTIEYSLRLWIDSSVEDEALIKNKSLSYKIDVKVEQEIAVNYVGMIKSAGIDVDYDVLPEDNYWQYREQITSVVFEDKIDIPDTVSADNQWDISVLGDNSVMAYVEEDGGTVTVNQEEVPAYKLHIQGNGKIIANVDSSFMFVSFKNMQTISNLHFLDTSNVVDMSYMFSECYKLTSLDISHFDTSNVTNMSEMFKNCSNLTSLDLSSFDTSNVTSRDNVFSDIPTDTQILVRDEAMKTWILGVRSDLTNIAVKTV